MHQNALALILVLLLSCSCSIKEDRANCPSYLFLDFSQINLNDGEQLLLNISNKNGFNYSDTLFVDRADASFGENGLPKEYMVEVPKTGVNVNVWQGVHNQIVSGEGLVIPLGEDCPRVYMYSSYLLTQLEQVREIITLNKNHCVLSLSFVYDEEVFPFQLAIVGDVTGYSLDGEPTQGEFRYLFNLSQDESAAKVVLPRQLSSSLQLQIFDDEELIKTFSIGNYIEQSGFDWSAKNLNDIMMDINYSNMSISFRIGLWENEYKYDLVI